MYVEEGSDRNNPHPASPRISATHPRRLRSQIAARFQWYSGGSRWSNGRPLPEESRTDPNSYRRAPSIGRDAIEFSKAHAEQFAEFRRRKREKVSVDQTKGRTHPAYHVVTDSDAEGAQSNSPLKREGRAHTAPRCPQGWSHPGCRFYRLKGSPSDGIGLGYRLGRVRTSTHPVRAHATNSQAAPAICKARHQTL